MTRVLWVTDEPPDRSLGGGSIRQSHLFEALASAFETDLLSVGATPEQRVRDLAASVTSLPLGSVSPLASVSWTEHPVGRRALSLAVTLGSRYPSALYPAKPVRRALAREVEQRAGRYSLICLEHEALAPLIPARRGQPWIITFHYLLSGMIERELALAPGWRQRWFRDRDLSKARALERGAVNSFDRCIVCSEEDAAALRSFGSDLPGDHVAVIPNGVDLARFRRTPVPAAPRVLLPGHLAWFPNVDGAQWFCAEVWPRVREAVQDAELRLVGRTPTADVLALGDLPGVSVHPDVPSMVPYFESSRVIVVPLRVGTGTRLKALEGLAAGRAVVGTAIGLEGIGIIHGQHALVADDSSAFAAAVVRALREDELARSLAETGRAHVESRFGWDRIGARFVWMVRQVLAGGHGTGMPEAAQGRASHPT